MHRVTARNWVLYRGLSCSSGGYVVCVPEGSVMMSNFDDFMSICYQSEPPTPKRRRAKSNVVGVAHTIENTLVYRELREDAKKKLRKAGK